MFRANSHKKISIDFINVTKILSDAYSRTLLCYYYREGSLIADTGLSLKPFANRSVTPANITQQIIEKTIILLEGNTSFKGLPPMTKGYENRTFADIVNGRYQFV